MSWKGLSLCVATPFLCLWERVRGVADVDLLSRLAWFQLFTHFLLMKMLLTVQMIRFHNKLYTQFNGGRLVCFDEVIHYWPYQLINGMRNLLFSVIVVQFLPLKGNRWSYGWSNLKLLISSLTSSRQKSSTTRELLSQSLRLEMMKVRNIVLIRTIVVISVA